jgi:hypothetical protein
MKRQPKLQRPLNEILQTAKKSGFAIDTTQYSEGWGSIALMKQYNDGLLVVGYDTTNGNFRGSYGDIAFDRTPPSLQKKERMIMLNDLFYLPTATNEENT